MFNTGNSVFMGGCDVGSDGEFVYVNRGSWYQNGSIMDVYRITLLDSDGDGDIDLQDLAKGAGLLGKLFGK